MSSREDKRKNTRKLIIRVICLILAISMVGVSFFAVIKYLIMTI